MSDVDPVELAIRALEHRERSRHEVDARLAQAGIDEDRRAEALDTLERLGYLDDARFAGARARALAGRGYGDDWIRHDLGEHGVEGETAEEAIAELAPERDRAAAVVERLGPGPKTAAHLGRKGFGADVLALAVAGTEG